MALIRSSTEYGPQDVTFISTHPSDRTKGYMLGVRSEIVVVPVEMGKDEYLIVAGAHLIEAPPQTINH